MHNTHTHTQVYMYTDSQVHIITVIIITIISFIIGCGRSVATQMKTWSVYPSHKSGLIAGELFIHSCVVCLWQGDLAEPISFQIKPQAMSSNLNVRLGHKMVVSDSIGRKSPVSTIVQEVSLSPLTGVAFNPADTEPHTHQKNLTEEPRFNRWWSDHVAAFIGLHATGSTYRLI